MSLDISQIKLDAQLRLQLAEKAEELQRLASRLYPGSNVLISDGTDSNKPPLRVEGLNGSADFAKLPFQQQIIRAFRDAGKPVSKNDLLQELERRGSKISNGTLLSYLSRGKGDSFERVERGLWKLKSA